MDGAVRDREMLTRNWSYTPDIREFYNLDLLSVKRLEKNPFYSSTEQDIRVKALLVKIRKFQMHITL